MLITTLLEALSFKKAAHHTAASEIYERWCGFKKETIMRACRRFRPVKFSHNHLEWFLSDLAWKAS